LKVRDRWQGDIPRRPLKSLFPSQFPEIHLQKPGPHLDKPTGQQAKKSGVNR